MSTFVPKQATPWQHGEMRALLYSLLCANLGRNPSVEMVCILHAKTVLETGRDGFLEGKYCWNHNVGNIRYVDKPDGLYTVLKGAWEEKPDGTVYYPPDQRFQAYPNLAAGINGLLHVLSTQKNFAEAWAVLTGPSPTAYSYAVAAKKGGYFTAKLDAYEPALTSICREFMRVP
jgi:hypothetical protein